MPDLALNHLNELPKTEALKGLRRCCAAEAWVTAMEAERPFASREELFRASVRSFESLTKSDWLEAFAAHPRIGDRNPANESSDAEWSSQEQSSIQTTAADILRGLRMLNDQYEKRFGFKYIVHATGRTTEEMISDLTRRMENDQDQELQVAANHQRQITQIRLGKLLDLFAGQAKPSS